MKHSFNLLSLLVLLSLVLAACGAPATEAPATEAPATEAPATEAPTEAPAMYECTDPLEGKRLIKSKVILGKLKP